MSVADPNPPLRIEDHALVGSTHGAALVHRDGTIAWLCLPRFDADAIFASLLGTREHGFWRIGALDARARVTRRYRPDTMVLETTIETDAGRATVLDFMPMPAAGGPHELVRIVEGQVGEVELSTELRLRFGYGLRRPWVQRLGDATVAVSGPDSVRVRDASTPEPLRLDEAVTRRVRAGERIALVLEWHPSHLALPPPRDPEALLRDTETETRAWTARHSAVVGAAHAEAFRRSLCTLKAMTYSPTGGIVAAPTTSLPEALGGERNWDYRFCWVRDAVLTLHALVRSGFRDEAIAWRHWLMRAAGGEPARLQIMYGLHGEARLTETELPHLPGFAGSRPVRIGNAASEQRQLDVYGSLLAAFHHARDVSSGDMRETWPFECAIADALASFWREPDSGLWESRGALHHHVHSKAMCWLAFERIADSARRWNLPGPVDDWERLRDEIHAEILAKGFDAESGSFVRFYGADDVDAALLQLPLLGFLPVDDPRIQGTIARIERDLVRHGVVYRYINARGEGGDGLRGTEGAFLACSFWLCDCYALSGRLDDATTLFERLLGFSNDVGLLAEEVEPVSRRQLGNFPQAFSHLALVNSAMTLENAKHGRPSYLARYASGEARVPRSPIPRPGAGDALDARGRSDGDGHA